MTDLTNHLDFLIGHLVKMEPRAAQSFLPGLAEDEMLKVFERINISPTQEIIELYRWRSGQQFILTPQEDRLPETALALDLKEKYFYDGFIEGFFTDFSYLLPIDAAVDHYIIYRDLQDYDGICVFPLYLFPFAIDAEEELFHLANLENGSVYLVNIGDDLPEAYLMYKSISTMLRTLIELYTTPLEKKECYIFKRKLFHDIWLKNNQEIGEEAISKALKYYFPYIDGIRRVD